MPAGWRSIVEAQRNIAHKLIEEFMLLANETVATLRRGPRHALPLPHPRAAGRAEGGAVRGVHFRLRLHAGGAARRGAAAEFSETAREAARQAGGAADCVSHAAHDAEGAVREREPGPLRPRGRFVHAFHVSHPPLSRSRRPSDAARAAAERLDDGARGGARGRSAGGGAPLLGHGAARRRCRARAACSGRKCGSWPTRSATSSTATSPASPRSGCSSSSPSTTSKGSCTCRAWPTTTIGFSRRSHSLRGENTQKVYQLGDRVEVQVVRVDMDRRQIDLGLVEILETVQER